MTQQPEQGEHPRVVVVGPEGMAVAGGEPGKRPDQDDDESITDLVNQPAKVMRIGSMIRQLLEEVRSARRSRTEPVEGNTPLVDPRIGERSRAGARRGA